MLLFFSHVINVPEEALEGGMTAESVERKLSIEDKSQWRQRRKNVDLLILMDFVSKSIESLHTLGPSHVPPVAPQELAGSE